MVRSGRKQRGRGRGYPDEGTDRGRNSRGRGRGRGRGGPGGYVAMHGDDGHLAFGTMDFLSRDRRDTPRGHGSRLNTLDDSDINSRYQAPVQETNSSRGSGFRSGRNWRVEHINPDPSRTELTPRRYSESKVLRDKTSLSQQLYENRPLLKSIAFVPSKLPSLFLNEEEIFKPMAEEADEQEASHAPTADRVFQIFHRSNLDPNSLESSSGAELPEIDFMDLGRVMNEIEVFEVEATSSKNEVGTSFSIKMAEDPTTAKTVEESFTRDGVDIKSSPVQDSPTPINHIPVEPPDTNILGEGVEDDDEIIVYVAPNPRKGIHASSSISSSSAPVVTIPLPLAASEPVSGQVQQGTNIPQSPTASAGEPTQEHIPIPSPKVPPVFMSGRGSNVTLSGSSRSVRRVRCPPRVSNPRVKRHVTFGSFGAIRAEAALREVDPHRDEQRRGDSDVDWGGSTSEGSLVDGGMLVDHDIDVYTMEAFVKGMSIAGSAQVTLDDLEDEARIRAEDEDDEKSDGESAHESNGSTGQYDEEPELAGETRIMLISDEEDIAIKDYLVESGDESTSEEEDTLNGSFQARLKRLRKQTQGRPIQDVLDDELGGEELEAEDEDSIIAQIQEILDDNDEIFRSQDRKQRDRIFQAINHGKPEFEIEIADGPARRKKNKCIPEELREQWERDRAKKAERKRLRELERFAATLDQVWTRKGSKRKKAQKARLAAALASPMSLETVVGLMRQFVADKRAHTHPLPPMERKMRKTIHDLALAFKLNSKSKGSGADRFTTLTKTTLSGVNVNEKAIARILGQPSSYVTHEGGKGKGRPRAGRIRPCDGEVVGEAAPKLDGSNIGFQMLSAMGWEEGGRIGSVGGLEAPLVAVIKTTKLGLGASKSSSRL